MLEVQDAGVVLEHLPVDLNKGPLQLQLLLVPLPGMMPEGLCSLVHEGLGRVCMPI